MRIITRSIVQGSGIWPTLFIIFVIDLRPLGLTNHITKYADDTSLLVPENADIDITAELQHVLKWAEVNELKLNAAKTKELVFHRPNPRNFIAPDRRRNWFFTDQIQGIL